MSHILWAHWNLTLIKYIHIFNKGWCFHGLVKQMVHDGPLVFTISFLIPTIGCKKYIWIIIDFQHWINAFSPFSILSVSAWPYSTTPLQRLSPPINLALMFQFQQFQMVFFLSILFRKKINIAFWTVVR
jgi:hypothetical protein